MSLSKAWGGPSTPAEERVWIPTPLSKTMFKHMANILLITG